MAHHGQSLLRRILIREIRQMRVDRDRDETDEEEDLQRVEPDDLGPVAGVDVVATLNAAVDVFALVIETAAMGHPDDFRVGGERAAVQRARPDHQRPASVGWNKEFESRPFN